MSERFRNRVIGQASFLVLRRRGEFGERKQAKGVDKQLLLAIDRVAPSTGKRPVRPVAWDTSDPISAWRRVKVSTPEIFLILRTANR